MSKNYIPTQYTIRNWGRIGHNTILKPSPKGIIVLAGDNASGKTSTMTTIYPLLIAGNLRSSQLFNSFKAVSSKNTDKVVHRNNNDERTLASSVLNGTAKSANALRNKNNELITDRIAFASATLDNETDAITFGVTVQIKNRALPKNNGQRWFIYRHKTGFVPNIISYDENDEFMLSLNDFAMINQEQFGENFQVFDTDAAYRRALAYELYGIKAEDADAFLSTYANRMQLIGSGALINSNIKIDDLKNNLRKAAPAVNQSLITSVIDSFVKQIEKQRHLDEISKLIDDLNDINNISTTAQFLKLIKSYYSKINSKQRNAAFLYSKLDDIETKIEQTKAQLLSLSTQKDQASIELAEKREIQKQQQSIVDTKKVLLTELSLLNEKQQQFKSNKRLQKKLQNNLDALTETKQDLEAKVESLAFELDVIEKVIKPLSEDILPEIPTLSLSKKSKIIKDDINTLNQIERKELQRDNASNNLSTFGKLRDKIIGLLSSISLLPGVKSIIENVKKEFAAVTSDEDNLKLKYDSEIKQLQSSLKTKDISKDGLKDVQKAILNVNNKIAKQTELQKDYEHANNELNNTVSQYNTALSDLNNTPISNDESQAIAEKQAEIDAINIPVDDIDNQVKIAEDVFNKISFKINDLNHNIELLTSQKVETNDAYLKNEDILQNEITSFKRNDVIHYQLFDKSFTSDMLDNMTDVSFLPTSFAKNQVATKLSNKIVKIHKLFDTNNDTAIEESTKYTSKLIQNINEFIKPSNPELPTIDGRISLFIENESPVSIDTSALNIINKLTIEQSKLQEEFDNDKLFYENNHAVSELVSELTSQHMAFDQLLNNAEDIMSQDENKNVIRINMRHSINHTLFTKEFNELLQTGISNQDATNIIKSIVKPFIDNYEGPISTITSDSDFIKDIQDKFDYRKWIDIEFLIANANSDDFTVVTQNVINSGSGGEKTYAIMIPLLTMLSLHLSSARKDSIPKLALFDELAAVLDEVNTTALLETINRFELSFFATTPASKEFNLARGNVPLSIYFITPGNGQSMNNYTKTFEYKRGTNIDLVTNFSE